MLQINTFGTIAYPGVFLSCFSEEEKKCFHAMPEHSLTYLYSGELTIENNNEIITIGPNECVFVRRDHRIAMNKYGKDNQPYKGITLSFNREVLREIYTKTKSNRPKNVPISDQKVFKMDPNVDITSLFLSLTPYFDQDVKPKDKVVYLKLIEAIYAMLHQSKLFYPILFDFSDPWKMDIEEFLNQNYMDELSLNEIAAYTGRSLATFKRDFKKISQLTPQKWLIKKRLEVAYQKLKEGEKVQNVYLDVGFKNPSHFSTAFRREYGIAPSRVLTIRKHLLR